ncbi:hypothetical protein D1818_14545 [Aquimarina sp. BL5]|uniref:hypothetical protein n=1 Tax=Aquimarina sp. BL5 TaxID=1714860 RepID=UPI000E4EDDF8|nr:hypothetical protein [Aquimarina sp. BL5]AXT52003.1 hypothetical protein D1818_14545 [Aquimarina sp. BL5]RKM94669.1 hypothetical protein D7036_21730 [Aquimarina sp. BL5]
MDYVICKQDKAIKGRILTTIVLVFSFVMLLLVPDPFYSRFLFFVGSLLVFGFSTSYRINKDFDNQKLFSVFGVVLFRSKLEMEYPDYISVFSGSFSLDNEWGAVSAIGTKERHEKLVVRFFTDNRKVTLYKSDNYQKALDKAKELSELLDLEIHDATKQ